MFGYNKSCLSIEAWPFGRSVHSMWLTFSPTATRLGETQFDTIGGKQTLLIPDTDTPGSPTRILGFLLISF